MPAANTKSKTKAATAVKSAQSASEKTSEERLDKSTVKVTEIDPEQYVTVKNGFQGRLIYKSARTGERFIWEEFGGEQEMQLRELRNAKNSAKSFFENNWFMFDEDWIVDYLGVRQFYKNAIKIEDFDKILTASPSELEKALNGMSEGQKRSASYRAATLIAEGKIDSRKAVSILEKTLGVRLIEE